MTENDDRWGWVQGLIAEAEAYKPAPARQEREPEVLVPAPMETARLAGTNVTGVWIAPDGMAVYRLAKAVL